MKTTGANTAGQEMIKCGKEPFLNVALISPDIQDMRLWTERLSANYRLAIQYFNSLKQLLPTVPDLLPDLVILDDYKPYRFPVTADLENELDILLRTWPDLFCHYYGIRYSQLSDLMRSHLNLKASAYDEKQLQQLKATIRQGLVKGEA